MNLKQIFRNFFSQKHKSIPIVQSLPIPLFWVNSDLTYQGCSQVYADILGVSSVHDVIGKRDSNFNLPQKALKARKALFQQILSGNSGGGVLYDCIENSNGHHTWIQTRCTPIIQNGTINAVLGVVKDITESAQTQRRLTKSSMQDTLIYQFLKEINEACLLSNDHHDIAKKLLSSINSLFDADLALWVAKLSATTPYLQTKFCTRKTPIQTLSFPLTNLHEQRGFLNSEQLKPFAKLCEQSVRCVFYFQLISKKRPTYHDIIFLANPNKTDVEHLKTIWEVAHRVANRQYIYSEFKFNTDLIS